MMNNRTSRRRRRRPMMARRCSCSISSKIRRRRRRSRCRRPSMEMMKKKINNNNNNNSCCLFHLIPVEIAADIFSRLPIDFVLQCKLVCKTWRDLIANCHHSNNNNNNNNNSIIVEMEGFLLGLRYYVGFHYGEYNNDDYKQIPCFNLTRKTIIHHEYPFQDSRNWYIVGSCNGLIALAQKWRHEPKPEPGRHPEPGTWYGALTLGRKRHREPETCNGLITLGQRGHYEPRTHHHHCDDMYVCNPYTGEYAKLPNPRLNHLQALDKAYGFGYHPNTKGYKVIRIYYQLDSTSTSVHVQVYTLGSGTAWRSIGKIKHKLRRSATWGKESDNNSWGILLNGVLYWLTETRKLIISFDLADEEFRDISTTPEFHGPSVLVVLNGCLCFSTGMYDSTRIWVMNNNDYSWIKKFSISWKYQRGFNPYYPLARLESGKILLHCNFHIFVSYDPETEHIVELKKMDRQFAIIPYMKSSVSLKALGEKEAIHVKAEALGEEEAIHVKAEALGQKEAIHVKEEEENKKNKQKRRSISLTKTPSQPT